MEIKSELNHLNISKICRTCLIEKDIMKAIFAPDESIGQSVAEWIMGFTNIQLKNGDGLPSLICIDCVHQADRAFSFKQLCERSDTNVRQFLERPPIIVVDTKKQEEEVKTTDCGLVNNFGLDDFSHKSNEEDEDVKDFSMPTKPVNPADTKQEEVETTDYAVVGGLIDSFGLDDTSNKCHTKGGGDEDFSMLFPGENYLNQHMIIHKKKKGDPRFLKHTCNYCKSELPDAASLDIHLKQHTGKKLLLCNICGKNFKYHSAFERHLRTHTGEHPFPCKICHKKYTRKSCLNIHMRTHTNERPFECNICQNRFTCKKILQVHMRTHRNERPFTCEFCKKTFRQSHHLTKHKRSHVTKTN